MTVEVTWIRGLRVPSPATLTKHGLTPELWLRLAEAQDFECFICTKTPRSGILHIDHQHVPRYYKKPPEKRRLFIRGLICQFCNRFVLARTMTTPKALRIVRYLRRYEAGNVAVILEEAS